MQIGSRACKTHSNAKCRHGELQASRLETREHRRFLGDGERCFPSSVYPLPTEPLESLLIQIIRVDGCVKLTFVRLKKRYRHDRLASDFSTILGFLGQRDNVDSSSQPNHDSWLRLHINIHPIDRKCGLSGFSNSRALFRIEDQPRGTIKSSSLVSRAPDLPREQGEPGANQGTSIQEEERPPNNGQRRRWRRTNNFQMTAIFGSRKARCMNMHGFIRRSSKARGPYRRRFRPTPQGLAPHEHTCSWLCWRLHVPRSAALSWHSGSFGTRG